MDVDLSNGESPGSAGSARLLWIAGAPCHLATSSCHPKFRPMARIGHLFPRHYFTLHPPSLTASPDNPDRPAPPFPLEAPSPRDTRLHPDYCPSGGTESPLARLTSPPCRRRVFPCTSWACTDRAVTSGFRPLISHPGGLIRTGGRGRRRIEDDLRVSEPWQGKGWLRPGLKAVHARVFVLPLPWLWQSAGG